MQAKVTASRLGQRLSTHNRRALTLALGSVGAQGIAVAVWPALTRLYEPADIGVFMLYFACANVAGVVASLRYEHAIILPTRAGLARNVAFLALGLATASAIIWALLVAVGRQPVSGLFGSPVLAGLLWVLPFAVLARGVLQVLSNWATRRQRFADLAAARVIQQAIAALIQVFAAILALGSAFALAIGHAVGLAVSAAVLWQRVGTDLWHKTVRRPRQRGLIGAAKRHRDFARFDVVAALLDTAALEIPVLLTGLFFAPDTVGFLGIAIRITGLPAALAVAAYGQVFYERAARSHGDGDSVRGALRDTLRPVAMVAVPAYMLLAVVGPSAFAFVFGEPWRVSGLYASVLAAPFLLATLVGPVSQLYFVFGQQRRLLFFQGWFFAASAVGFGLGGIMQDAFVGVIAFSVIGSARHLLMLIDMRRLAGTGLEARTAATT